MDTVVITAVEETPVLAVVSPAVKVTISETEPDNPTEGDLWIQPN